MALESVVREMLDDVASLSIADGHQITLVAHADDIIIIEETEESVRQTTKTDK